MVEKGSVRLNWKARRGEAAFICTHMAVCELHAGGRSYAWAGLFFGGGRECFVCLCLVCFVVLADFILSVSEFLCVSFYRTLSI